MLRVVAPVARQYRPREPKPDERRPRRSGDPRSVLTLAELRRVRDAITAQMAGHVVERWVQPDGEHVVVALYGRDDRDPRDESNDRQKGARRKRFLLASCRPDLARLSETDALPKAPDRPPAFVSYLRAHLSRARLVGARLIGDDRILALRFTAKEGEYDLVLAIFGKRSNLYVLDGSGVIVAVLRPPADTRPEMAMGNVFVAPGHGAPREGDDRFSDSLDAELLRAIEHEYADRERSRDASSLARDIRQSLKRERKNADRRLAKIEEELAEADQANTLQRHGELLKGALGRIVAGENAVTVEDYETGEHVRIPLDPAKSAKQNLAATFKRYQKLLRRLTKAGGQIDAARAWCETLAALGEALEAAVPEGAAPDPVALERLADRPEIARMLGRRRAAQSSGQGTAAPDDATLPARLRGVPKRLVPRRYLSRDGLEIWVGRNDAGNDYLSTRLARGNDLFFHLDGAPGSHVILRTEGRPDPPQESLLDASELAVHFSKQKNAGRADVHVVPIKQVKKPKGAKPGLVWVTGGRTLHLRREEARLKRVLESRIEG